MMDVNALMTLNFDEWYWSYQAVEVLRKNSGKNVQSVYLRKLAQRGKIETITLGPYRKLYNKDQVDSYIVEDPGVKARRRREMLQLISLRKCSIAFLRRVPHEKKKLKTIQDTE